MLETLYQDEWIWLINKPSLIHSVINKNSKSPSIAEQILSKTPDAKKISLKDGDAGLLNRLDYETSGIIIAAKSRIAWATFRSTLMKGEMQKSYLVILEGNLKKSITLDNWIGSRHRGSKKVSLATKKAEHSKKFLQAVSRFEIKKYDKLNDLSLVEVTAATARRHQIRAHASHIKHPLIGDKLYGSKRCLAEIWGVSNEKEPSLPPFFLHAWKISFNHPFLNKSFEIVAPIGARKLQQFIEY